MTAIEDDLLNMTAFLRISETLHHHLHLIFFYAYITILAYKFLYR